MEHDPVQTVIGYHDRTKHQPGRYARSLGYLDWATQPDPFRRYAGAPLIKLPIPEEREQPRYDELFMPGAVTAAPLGLETISTFFYLSLALSAWKQAGGTRWALRCNPSSGNLHPTEGYAILPAMAGLSETAGVYHYAPREHGLEQRARMAEGVFEELVGGFVQPSAGNCFLAALSSLYWREAWKYGERAFRYCHHDLGHALAALRLAAASLGWRLVVLEGLGDEDVARLLGLNRGADFVGAEAEYPDLAAIVFPADRNLVVSRQCDPAPIEAVAEAEWVGRANQLSPDHVDWDIIAAVHEASGKPRTSAPHLRATGQPRGYSEASLRDATAFHIIRSRRSALAFDGTTGISVEALYRMLTRVMPGEIAPPWDAIDWNPRVHLFLFVHLVHGLTPGVYALVRDPMRIDELRANCDSGFLWTVPDTCPEKLPFFQMVEADCRRAAAQLSLGQDIAGMSAFSLSMVAEFEQPLQDNGAWDYRRLFWEAGMVGQVLYLEAEAAGLRATGIGAYFDDLVHEAFGMSGHRFQSLYHFTVGGPIEDTRIVSAPAYEPWKA